MTTVKSEPIGNPMSAMSALSVMITAPLAQKTFVRNALTVITVKMVTVSLAKGIVKFAQMRKLARFARKDM